jgi:hypothetical protein
MADFYFMDSEGSLYKEVKDIDLPSITKQTKGNNNER